MSQGITVHVDEAEAGTRVDAFLATRLDDVSRAVVQKAVKAGNVSINGRPVKRASRAVSVGDEIVIALPEAPTIALDPEAIPIDIVYQDEDVVVVNKPVGLVVHPAPGHASGTLLNAILHHCPDFTRPGDDPKRPGVVHRIDRDTSGLLVIAKSSRAMASLAEQARDHTFDRRYLALVRGEFPEEEGRINAAVGRSLADRKRMTVTATAGRDAVTRFRVAQRFGIASEVALQLETGRTHQIRVHLRFAGHPILGDPVYGVTDFRNWPDSVRSAMKGLKGQALHAETLGFTHPTTGEQVTFRAAPPERYARAREALVSYAATGA